jgi:di/tricarboxylate transporter
VANPIVKLAGRSESRLMALISATVGSISGLMQNIGAAALFLPATQRICKRLEISVSRILMPMGFCAIVGGTLTLVGASPTILLNDLMVLEGEKLAPFGLFTQTPIGICLLLSVIIYFLVLGKFILPVSDGETDRGGAATLLSDYPDLIHLFELHVPEHFEGPKTLEELAIRKDFLVTVVATGNAARGKKRFVPRKRNRIAPGDDLVIIGKEANVRALAKHKGWQLKDGLDFFVDEFARTNAGLVEVVVSPRSELINKTLGEVRFQKYYRVNPIAIHAGERFYLAGINHVGLKMGDAILLQGPWDRFHRIRRQPLPRPFTFTTPLEGEILRPAKAKLAVLWLAVALSQIIFFNVQLSVALMSGALGMIITGVLSVDEAYHSVDWMTVFLLAGLIPLGVTFEQTGTAAYMASGILELIGAVPPIVLLAVFGILTSFFTLVISNVGATVLLVPLCMNVAIMAGGDPRMAALVVGLSASNTFILPTHQVNALIMRPGGYRTVDYTKAGAVMTVIFLAVMLTAIYLFYGVK